MRISDWSADVCSSDLQAVPDEIDRVHAARTGREVHDRVAAGGVTEDEAVVAVAADQDVVTASAVDDVVTLAAVEDVRAGIAQDGVDPLTADRKSTRLNSSH